MRNRGNRHASSKSIHTLQSTGQLARQRQARRARVLMEALEPRQLISATVITDQLDYAFGSTAQITGNGFAQGETVQLQVRHAPGTAGSNDDPQNQAWQVVDGGAGDLDGIADGNIQTTWVVDDPDAVGASYVLTATGVSSGEVATSTFTDSISGLSNLVIGTQTGTLTPARPGP